MTGKIYTETESHTLFKNMVILHFQILKKKKKIDAAHFLNARGNEKQVFNLEWPYCKIFCLKKKVIGKMTYYCFQTCILGFKHLPALLGLLAILGPFKNYILTQRDGGSPTL